MERELNPEPPTRKAEVLTTRRMLTRMSTAFNYFQLGLHKS